MEKIKSSRVLSFIAVGVIYLIAACAGAAVFFALPFPFWLSLLIADIAATVVVFAFSLLFKNSSVYDPYWSVQPIVILVLCTVRLGFGLAQLLPLVAVTFWGLRLTINWAYSFRGFTVEDWRYVELRKSSGRAFQLVNFFGIHLVPTLIVYACTLPAVFLYYEEAYFRPICAPFFLISIGAVVLQLVSDTQMHRYHGAGGRGLLRNTERSGTLDVPSSAPARTLGHLPPRGKALPRPSPCGWATRCCTRPSAGAWCSA